MSVLLQNLMTAFPDAKIPTCASTSNLLSHICLCRQPPPGLRASGTRPSSSTARCPSSSSHLEPATTRPATHRTSSTSSRKAPALSVSKIPASPSSKATSSSFPPVNTIASSSSPRTSSPGPSSGGHRAANNCQRPSSTSDDHEAIQVNRRVTAVILSSRRALCPHLASSSLVVDSVVSMLCVG